MAKSKKEVRGGVVMYLDGRAVESNARAIQAEMKKVKKEIDACTIGSEEYVRKTKEYRRLNAILQEHKANLKDVATQVQQNHTAQKNWLQWGISKFNEYSVAILGAAAALTGVTMKLQEFRKKGREKEESQANLQALTGLDDNSIAWLTQQAEKLSTTMDDTGLRIRQSSREILDAYTLVGSAKPELLENKEALNSVTVEAIRLANAAKMDLKPAADGLTLAMNQYGAAADEATRYTNALAAGSKFGSAGVESQTESIVKAGVAASTANVKIESLVGSIEALAERGIKGSIAGTGLKTFFLKLEGMSDDVRPSVVGLQTALENLQAKQLSASQMQKMFGLEAYTVAQAMISGAEKVKYYTEAVTGTNVATEQAAINSDTAAAKLDQMKNKMNETGMILAERLSPFFNNFVNLTSKFVQAMPGMLDWLDRYGVQFAILGASIYLYSTRLKIASTVTAAWTAITKAATAIQTAYNTAMMYSKAAIDGSALAHARLSIALRGQNLLVTASVAVTNLLKAAWYALTLQFGAAKTAMTAFNIALAKSGWGALILAVGAAAAVIYEYTQRVRDAEKELTALERVNSKVDDEYGKQEAKLKRLNDTVHDSTIPLRQRKEALAELQELVPDYLAKLDKEGKLYDDNKDAIDKYCASLEKSIRLKSVQDEMEEAYKRKTQLERNKKKAEDLLKKDVDLNNRLDKIQAGAGMSYSNANASKYIEKDKENIKDIEDNIKKVDDDIAFLKDKLKELDIAPKTVTKVEGDDDGGGGSGGGGSTSAKVTNAKNENAALNAVTEEYLQKENDLRKRYASDVTFTQAEYNRQMEALELERLNKSLEVAGLEPKQREEIEQKIQEIYVKAKEKYVGYLESIETEGLDGYAKELLDLKNEQQKEIDALNDAYAKKLMDKETYEQMKIEIEKRYNGKRIEAFRNSDEYKNMMEGMKENVYNAQKFDEGLRDDKGNNFRILAYYINLYKEIDKAKEALANMDPDSDEYKVVEDYMDGLTAVYEEKGEQLKSVLGDLAESIGTTIGVGIKGSKDAVQDALKSIALVLVDGIEKMILASMAIPTLEALTGIGAGKAWADLGKILAVKAATAALKSNIQGWESGGYTGVGAHDAPAGIVHKGEFVANRFALANPDIKAVLDLIDTAQRKGNVQNLTAEDIRAVSGHGSAGGAAISRPVVNVTTDNSRLESVLRNVESTMAEAVDAYKQPSPAYCYLDGDGGINRQQELLQKMKSNARR